MNNKEKSAFNKTEYDNKYKREHYIYITSIIKKETENDIIEHYKKQSNKTQYIKDLIRKDMNK